MLHYTPPGVVGGVEQILHRHGEQLRDRGMAIEFVAGRPSELDEPVHVIRELDIAADVNVEIERELEAGVVSERFYRARSVLAARLWPLLASADAIVVHNAFTLHFSLPLTSVLWEFAGRTNRYSKFVAWTHDLSWTNPLYLPTLHPGHPWWLLRVPAPGVRYVTVSHERKRELESLWGESRQAISVIPNGIDIDRLLRLSALARGIATQHGLWRRDITMLLPVRVTRRKNIEMAVRTVGALKDRGLDVCLIVSGPSASHHPRRSQDYLSQLKALRDSLELENEVVFLADELGTTLSDEDIAELYSMADCLFLPSESEGFGLPLLEAGVLGMPVIASRLSIFQELAGSDASYFSLNDDPATVAGIVLAALDTPEGRFRRRVRKDFRWESIVDRLLVPLLGGGPIRATSEVGPTA